MKTILKCVAITVCLSLFAVNTVCLAQSENEAAGPSSPPTDTVVGPMSDFDTIQPDPGPLGSRAEHWRERASGLYLEYFDINSGVILGWTLYPASDWGYDKWGNVDSSFTAHWATMGGSRFAHNGEIAYTSLYPYSSYSYVNAWGGTGSNTMVPPASYYNGSLYESFFDNDMTGPGGVGWTDDGTSNWGIHYASDPGNYIDNRVYYHSGNGTVTGWKGTTYDYGYSWTYGFSFNADVRRRDEDYGKAYGLQFFSDSPAGQSSDCYSIHLSDNTGGGYHAFSIWKYTSGSPTALIGWTNHSAINGAGEWNNVKVETLNGNMEFWVNGISMGTVYDTSHTAGDIGLSFYDSSGYGSCEWDNITVHRQPSVALGQKGGGTNPDASLCDDTHAGP